MKAGMAADPGQSSRSKPVIEGVVPNALRWIGEIREAAKNFLRLRHPAPTESRAESVTAEARPAQAETDSTDAKLTTPKSFTTAPTADANVGPIAARGICQTVPDQQEVERRRELIRMLFNDFWNGVYNKPAAFAQRFDEAEDYLNARLEAHGES
jgi:hypothetical protein